MPKDGYAKLWRSSERNEMYLRKPFDRWHAWQDLWAMMASWEDSEVFYQHRYWKVQRGQIVTSIKYLASRWGWSRGKVKRFIKTLTLAEMIRTSNDQGYLRITVCNYGRYQDKPKKRPLNKTPKGQKGGQSMVTPTDTDKEVLEGEEGKNALGESVAPVNGAPSPSAEPEKTVQQQVADMTPEAAKQTLLMMDTRGPDTEFSKELRRRAKEPK